MTAMPKEEKTLAQQFEEELLLACNKAEKLLPRRNLTTRTLIERHGAVKAATQIVMFPKINDGFVDLLLIGKGYLTVEYIVCKKKYVELFSEDVRNKALEKIGFLARTKKRHSKKKPIVMNKFR